MKKCKCCLKTISLLGGDYCDGCYKRLPLHKKFVEGLKREHFFKSCATNRHFSNFSEYALKSSLFVSQCRSPKFYNLIINKYNLDYKTFLNDNIKSNFQTASSNEVQL
ncbi:MAG: hypothetical protein ACTSXY_12240, partial [Promethearchaeota archaeon]